MKSELYNSSYITSFPGDFYFINEKQKSCFFKKIHCSALPLEKCLDLKKSSLISLMAVCWLHSIKMDKKYSFVRGNLTFQLKYTFLSLLHLGLSIPFPFRYLLFTSFLLWSESFCQGIVWWKTKPGFIPGTWRDCDKGCHCLSSLSHR